MKQQSCYANMGDDVDNNKMFVTDTEEIVFHGGRSGWCWCLVFGVWCLLCWCVKGIRDGDGDTEPRPIYVVVIEILEHAQAPEGMWRWLLRTLMALVMIIALLVLKSKK